MLDHARSLALEQAGADESGGGQQEAAAMAVCAGWVRKALSGYPHSLEQDEALLRNGTVADGRVRSLVELRLDDGVSAAEAGHEPIRGLRKFAACHLERPALSGLSVRHGFRLRPLRLGLRARQPSRLWASMAQIEAMSNLANTVANSTEMARSTS